MQLKASKHKDGNIYQITVGQTYDAPVTVKSTIPPPPPHTKAVHLSNLYDLIPLLVVAI